MTQMYTNLEIIEVSNKSSVFIFRPDPTQIYLTSDLLSILPVVSYFWHFKINVILSKIIDIKIIILFFYPTVNH